MRNSLLLLIALIPFALFSQKIKAVDSMMIWPGTAPGENKAYPAEVNTTDPLNDKSQFKGVIRLTNVTKPTITVYRPKASVDKHMGMIVCPGGGYGILAYNLEGTEICEWLNANGITAFLLKYRVPRRDSIPFYQAPLQDAQRAMGLIRSNAAKYGVRPDKIGIMGFSAGGHLSAALSTNYATRNYPLIDEADKVSCRPDFVLLVYPAYLAIKEDSNRIAKELPVTKETPTTLLFQTEDDGVRVECSLFYYLALKQAGVPAEMHLFAKGGHGYGLRSKERGIATWPLRAAEWLKDLQ